MTGAAMTGAAMTDASGDAAPVPGAPDASTVMASAAMASAPPPVPGSIAESAGPHGPRALNPAAGTDSPVAAWGTNLGGDGGGSAASALAAGAGATSPAPAPESATPGPQTPASLLTAGDPGEQVAVRISRAVQDGDKSLTLELHPAELGRVEVRLSFHAEGVGVQMTLDRPDAFDAFSRNRAGLEQQLAQAGIGLAGGGLDLRLGQQSGQQESERRAGSFRVSATSAAVPAAAAPAALRWLGHGLVDIVA